MSTNGNGEVTPHRDRPRKELVHFAPGSLHLDELQAGRIAELGCFSSPIQPSLLSGSSRAAICCACSGRRIPQLLPPYRIELCQDVLGWNESGTLLHAMRETNFRGRHFGLQGVPYLYTVARQAIEQDLAQRMPVAQDRREHPAFHALFHAAMRSAQHDLELELASLNSEEGNKNEHLGCFEQGLPPYHSASSLQGRLPAPGTQQGDEAVSSYKLRSYHLLKVGKGMCVLDVGCGTGIDLPSLAHWVGDTGRVVGLAIDPHLVRAAR